MTYKLRPGVELINVCGTNLLIPSRIASEYCGSLCRLNVIETIYIQQFMKGNTLEEVSRVLSKLSRRDPGEMAQEMKKRFDLMAEKGFLIPEDEP